MAEKKVYERTLEETPTWAVAAVFFVLIAVSVVIEHLIHIIGKWLNNRHKKALFEAVEKVKAELMLLGFISLLLTVLQEPISGICVSKSVANSWHPCTDKLEKDAYSSDNKESRRRLLSFLDSGTASTRRSLATKAIFHVLYCLFTLALGRTKMKKWKAWENETKTIEYQYYNDPERFRFARDTSFGRRHLNIWSKSSISLWIAHLAPGSETKFDFQKYISRSLEEDFKDVVGITPILWFIATLFLLTNTHGWFAYLWLPFIPLFIILLVGAKLQVIITKLGLRIQERGDVVKGAPVVQPGDDLFWFGRPRFILFLIHLVLFQNAFQLAFFSWSTYEFALKSCFHKKTEDIAIRISMGYVTLPLYALVTQMGSTMKPTIFNDRVAAALKNWHHIAKKHTKQGRLSGSNTPMSSRPQTPTHGMSPVHLLHNYPNSSYHSNFEHEHWDPENQIRSPRHHREIMNESPPHYAESSEQEVAALEEPRQIEMQLPPGPGFIHTHHEFSFGK
ncbi:MLO-like protein 12 [Citrus sinensis]|nr:MLO-like protein 12 [Citrus sinensis]